MRKQEARLRNRAETKMMLESDSDTDRYLLELRKKLVVDREPDDDSKSSGINLMYVTIALIMAFSFAVLLGPSLTGLITAGEGLSFNQSINLAFSSSSEYNLDLNEYGNLKSIKLSGQLQNNTAAKVYIENDGARYLIFDSNKLNAGTINSITALAIDESSDEVKNDSNGTEANETQQDGAANSALSEPSDAINGSINESGDSISETIDDALNQIINETNETINETTPILNDSISSTEETTNISLNKSISMDLKYKKDTVYDPDDNGIGPITNAIDFTVEGSSFSFEADASRLCTRWEIYSVEDDKSTTACYGSDGCCSLIGLEPLRDSWSEPLYLTYGLYGASYNNIVSAQIIYNDEALVAGSWANLTAKFDDLSMTKFEDVCADTCSLTGFNKSSYKLIIELERGTIVLDRISYTVERIKANEAPELVKEIGNYTIGQGTNTKVNLSEHFHDADGDTLVYSYYRNENFDVSIEDDIATITPAAEFTGAIYTFFTANDSSSFVVSNIFSLNVFPQAEEESFVQVHAEINKPVVWRQTVKGGAAETRLALPETAFNVSIRKADGNEVIKDKLKVNEKGRIRTLGSYEISKGIEKLSRQIDKEKKRIKDKKVDDLESELQGLLKLGAPVINESIAINETQLIISDNSTSFNVTFSTPAPEVFEEQPNDYTKLITISSV